MCVILVYPFLLPIRGHLSLCTYTHFHTSYPFKLYSHLSVSSWSCDHRHDWTLLNDVMTCDHGWGCHPDGVDISWSCDVFVFNLFLLHILSVLLRHSTETCLWCPLLWSHTSTQMGYVFSVVLRSSFSIYRDPFKESGVFKKKETDFSSESMTMKMLLRMRKETMNMSYLNTR